VNRQLTHIFSRLGGEAALSDTFLAACMSILGLMASSYAIQATLRLRSEEANGLAEVMLTAPVGRLRWAASHLLFAVVGPALALAAAGLAAGIVYGLAADDVGGQLPCVLAGAMVQMPAVVVLAGIAVALFGLAPRLSSLSWAVHALFLLLGQLLTYAQTSKPQNLAVECSRG
jgi:putative exporter of polyketide antibiotics